MQAYRVYLGALELPVTPSKITVSNENRNETVELVNEDVVSNPKCDGLVTFEFDFLIPLQAYPFVNAKVLERPDYYCDWLAQRKQKKEAFQFIVTRNNGFGRNTNVKVLLEDYSYVEDAESGNDYVFSVTLKEYREWHNMEVDVSLNHHLINAKYARGWR